MEAFWSPTSITHANPIEWKIEFVTNVEYKNECIVLHEKEGKNHNVENSLKKSHYYATKKIGAEIQIFDTNSKN